MLLKAGYNAVNMKGGMFTWSHAGLSTKQGG
jgi:rhodanese-related sulfurtransferase